MTQEVDLDAIIDALGELGFVVRDAGLLASALHRPHTTLFGDDAYPSLSLKGAALVESLAQNHPMVDGNKRSAWICLNVFLGLNGYELRAQTDDAYAFMLDVANSRLSLEATSEWIAERLVALG